MKQKSIVIASCLVANFPQAHEKGTSRRERKTGKECIYEYGCVCLCVSVSGGKKKFNWIFEINVKTMNSYCYWAVALLRDDGDVWQK